MVDRWARWFLLTAATLMGCSDDAGVGISIVRIDDLVENEGRDRAELSVFVSQDCFYSVTVGGALQASGRWASGERSVRLGTGVLRRCDNDVRIQVAAADGSSGEQDAVVWWCRAAGCAGECNGGEPDAGADSGPGPIDPYPGPLCDPCTSDGQCEGPPNLCVPFDGVHGLCGTDCYDNGDCLGGFECTEIWNDYGFVGQVCLHWPPQATCPAQ